LRFKLMHPETCCPYSPDDPASEVTSDAAGRYTVFVPAARWVVLDLPAGSGFYAPCAPGFDSTQAKGEMNIDVVSEAVLMTTGLPDSLPSTVINVRGSVVERTASGTTRAVPGASVWFSGEVDSVPQPGTLSDVRGNFLLCTSPPGTGTDVVAWVRAAKTGYRAAAQSVTLGWDYRVSLELVRD
jgi:hypothetical protein